MQTFRLVLITLIPASLPLFSAEPAASPEQQFELKIRPVLAARCYPCHSAASPTPQGGLTLDSTAGIKKGGNSGAVIAPGNPDASLLIRAVRHTDAKLKMPPGNKPLPAETIAEFEAWVKAGAPLPADRVITAAPKRQLWSLSKPERSPGDIDSFITAKLAEKNLTLSPEADRRTLIRRATFDLTGLPPTADEVTAFVSDKNPDAYEKLIDRLLASPHYGERWGRHWLDVARYADSVNDSVNAGQRYPWSYTYRDWVIRSLNADLPYNEFLLYQLAADKLSKVDPKHLAALGYLSLGREFPNSFPETVDDRIDAVARGMLGLTVACARCHDHKYDPIPTKDYYSFYSVFSNIRDPDNFPRLTLAAAPGLDPKQATYQQRLAKIRAAEQDYRERRNREMVAFFKAQEPDYRKAAADAEKLSNTEVEDLIRDRQLNLWLLRRWQKYLKNGGESPTDITVDHFDEIATEGDRNNMRSIRVRYGMMLAQAAYDGAEARAMAVEDLPNPTPAHVFLRGNPNNPGALAPPHFLSCLGGSEEKTFKDGSGRLELAKAIIDPENPLTARVIVNRVWMHHFGSGLVRTPSDFGFRGDPPTHPELLDTLAVTFRDDYKWSLKKLHRSIMLSKAYRQASMDNETARRIDPENQLLWRANRKRLEIEAVRDEALATAAGLISQSADCHTPSKHSLPFHGVPFTASSNAAACRAS